ncbi:MAG: DUF4129 domain-containing protein [Dehalococcoidia bacterium]
MSFEGMGARATDWKQASVDVLFVTAEAIAWYIILRVGATAFEQATLTQIDERIRRSATATDLAAGTPAAAALDLLQRAMHVEHGPGLWIVLATALGGFFLMRGLVRARFEGALGAVVLIAASVLALNVLLHVAVAGDLRIWDPGSIAATFADAGGSAGAVNLDAFVRRPDVTHPHGATVSFVFAFMVGMWVRFLLAGRSLVTFDRVLRSFTAGFLITIGGLALAGIEGISGVSMFAVPQFIAGILALAVANNARSDAPVDGARRTGPWLAAVGGTVAILLGVALLLGTLAFLNVGVVLSAIGELAWVVIAFLVILVVTPIYWVIVWAVRLVRPDGVLQLPNLPNLQLRPPGTLDGADEAAGSIVPLWAQNGLKFLAVALIVYAVFRLAVLIMRRRYRGELGVDEVRAQTAGGIGVGALLRGMLPGGRRAPGDEWTRRQPIYRLYAGAARAAEERGFRYLPGETPIEFGVRAGRVMGAPPYPPIGLAFDRARYGRHLPEEGQVRALEAGLASWEAATPPTEALRQRLAGASPLSSAEEFLLGTTARRRAITRTRRLARGAPEPEESSPPLDPMS